MASGIRTTRTVVEAAYAQPRSPGVRATRTVVEAAYAQPRSPGVRATRAVVEVAYGFTPATVTEDDVVLIIVE